MTIAPQIPEAKGSFIINTQYIKDLSFEVPSGPSSFFFDGDIEPQISFDVSASSIEKDVFETAIITKIELKVGGRLVYIVELDYRGVFTISNIQDPELLKQTLLVQCPQFLYPFSRAILAQTITASSFAVPNMNPIDFYGLYMAKVNDDASQVPEGTVKN